jgi:tetratricopeptide (TPR) repeat protein
MLKSSCLAAVALLALVGAAPPAIAQPITDDVEKARAHFERGQRLYEVGDYQQALAEFRAAHAAKPDSAFLYNVAQCLRGLGDLHGALAVYRRFVTAAPESPARPQAERRIHEIQALLATPATTPASGGAALDLRRPVSGDTAPPPTLGLNRPPSKQNPEQGPRWLPWAGAGVAAALAGGAVIAGWSMQSRYDDLLGTCGSTPLGCNTDEIDGVRGRMRLANLLWGLTAASALATGVLFYLDVRGDDHVASVAARF